MRLLVLLALVLVSSACHAPVEHTGKRPLGARRAPEYEATKTAAERTEARASALRRRDTPDATNVDATDRVIGAHATSVYHVATCDLTHDIARAERVIFVSNFDALDGGYKPCPRCRPGP